MKGFAVIFFIILGLFLILAVTNALTYNHLSYIEGNHNIRVCVWLNVLAAIIAIIAIALIIYLMVVNRNGTSTSGL